MKTFNKRPATTPVIDPIAFKHELAHLAAALVAVEDLRPRILADLTMAEALHDEARAEIAQSRLNDLAVETAQIERRRAEIIAQLEQHGRAALAEWDRRWREHVRDVAAERRRRIDRTAAAAAAFRQCITELRAHPGEVDRTSDALFAERGRIVVAHDGWAPIVDLPAPEHDIPERQLSPQEFDQAVAALREMMAAERHTTGRSWFTLAGQGAEINVPQRYGFGRPN